MSVFHPKRTRGSRRNDFAYGAAGSSPAQVIAQNFHAPFSRRAAIVSSPAACSLAFGPSSVS